MRSPFRSPSPVSVLDGLPLTSASLELPAFQKASADHSVLKFALSQQRYAHLYVVEGAKAFASWENSDVQSAKSVDIIAVDAKARDLLSSPLLRPRVGYNDSHSNNRSVAPDSVVSNTSPRPVEKGGAALARAKPQKTARRDSIKGKDNKKKAPSAKPAATLEEEEAKNRLAERRDRKRAKRAILKPPTPAASSTASSSRSRSPPAKKRKWDCVASPHDLSLADMHREARTGADRKTKNDTGAAGKNTKSGRKKVKIAPGLALMQNFSAKNIGRERITVSQTPNSAFPDMSLIRLPSSYLAQTEFKNWLVQ
ncbi:hypothetical protein BOTBODRAFT_608818 [Botryobasidium botryosum FD-172 SS1]|uniref:Uncharacterized protein n=1 Tax=Botryobasidium botryosum (strain FD-172 SS1) TaxID=930990 RepID=A0A067LYM8_BOTB1|nr:hypothetical protein BOTBODRAFT_608818 [Botryobasidium botryosum FD-172 SS1]